MRAELLARIVAGAYAGSLILTANEALELARTMTPHAAVIVNGRTVPIALIPWHTIPDTIDQLPELDPWRTQAHESLVEGLIDGTDQLRLFETADPAARELRRIFDQDAPDA